MNWQKRIRAIGAPLMGLGMLVFGGPVMAKATAAYPSCSTAADNQSGYGDVFSCGTNLCRKINDNWDQNQSEEYWCRVSGGESEFPSCRLEVITNRAMANLLPVNALFIAS
jgi:hypothetical protein